MRLNRVPERQDGDAATDPPQLLTREPDASTWRRLTARVLGWLPIESQL